MSRHNQAWVRLPLEVLRMVGLTKTDAVVLSLIIDRCIDSPDRSAAISAAWLADSSRASARQICRSCAALESLGLIERQRTGRATRYTLRDGVELLPPKIRKGGKGKPAPADDFDAEGYLSLVNNFK